MHEYKSEHKLPILLRPKWIWFRKYRIVNLVSSAANFNKLIWNNEFTAASLNWVLSRPNGIPISGTSKINFEFHNPKCWLQVWFYYCDCSRVCGKIQTIHSFGLAKQEVASTIQQERHKNKRNRNRKDSINPEQPKGIHQLFILQTCFKSPIPFNLEIRQQQYQPIHNRPYLPRNLLSGIPDSKTIFEDKEWTK